MSQDAEFPLELAELFNRLCEGELAPEQAARLEESLRTDPALCRLYLRYIDLYVELRRRYSTAIPPVSTPHVLINPIHDTVGFFSSGWPVAYLVATVISGIALLVGSLTPVSQPTQVARQSVPLPSHLSSLPSVIGRITGMVDCQFVEGSGFRVQSSGLPSPAGRGAGGEGGSDGLHPSSFIPHPSSPVRLGDTFALASGLMEITYETGAKVILQGPMTYEVESKDGGFLSLGKLTARVERTKSEDPGPKTQDLNPKSEISKSPNLQISKFVVRTPTATVTDLGTEFGVEVDKSGTTQSHVFRGSVRVQAVASGGMAGGAGIVLIENDSARVERSRDAIGGGGQITVARLVVSPASFVREIPKPTIKTFDLVDVVAGGDGFSGKRDAGIDPTNGRLTPVSDISPQGPNPMMGDGKYHRVAATPLVDGVFIPRGGEPVQLDSAGHTCADFPVTDNKACCFVAASKYPDELNELGGINYNTPGHGLLELDANKGITFDLQAIRRANPNYKLVRFRAVTGNTERVSEKGLAVYADVWVFVDGQVRFRRREITRFNGAMPIAIPINDNDRFLTLVSTDGGNGYDQDHIMFGDPRLELAPAKDRHDMSPPPDGGGERR